MDAYVKNLIQALETSKDFGFLVEDCKSLFSRLQNIHINFVFREANIVAHRLAHFALSIENTFS